MDNAVHPDLPNPSVGGVREIQNTLCVSPYPVDIAQSAVHGQRAIAREADVAVGSLKTDKLAKHMQNSAQNTCEVADDIRSVVNSPHHRAVHIRDK